MRNHRWGQIRTIVTNTWLSRWDIEIFVELVKHADMLGKRVVDEHAPDCCTVLGVGNMMKPMNKGILWILFELWTGSVGMELAIFGPLSMIPLVGPFVTQGRDWEEDVHKQ